MPRFCKFIDPSTDGPVFVNPALVRYVRPDVSDGTTRIVFDADQGVAVQEDFQSVVKALDDANRS